MSGLDVEALLESAAKSSTPTKDREERDDRHKSDRSDRRERDRARDGSRDRDRDRKRRDRSRERRRDRDGDGDVDMKSPRSDKGSATGSLKSSRRRSRSRDDDRRHARRERHREEDDPEDPYTASAGDYYRGGGRPRTRSRSPDEDRYYRPSGRGREDRDGERDRPRERERDRDRERERDGDRDRHRRDDRRPREREGRKSSPPAAKSERSKSKEPQLTEDERDRRTVFVQQLAARLRTKELIAFFEKVGPVQEAQIVKDRVSGRSKGYFISVINIIPLAMLTVPQCWLCRIQARRFRSTCNSAHGTEAPRYSNHRAAYRSREESSSTHTRRHLHRQRWHPISPSVRW